MLITNYLELLYFPLSKFNNSVPAIVGLTVGNGSVISHDLQVGACFPFDVDVIPLQKKKKEKRRNLYPNHSDQMSYFKCCEFLV